MVLPDADIEPRVAHDRPLGEIVHQRNRERGFAASAVAGGISAPPERADAVAAERAQHLVLDQIGIRPPELELGERLFKIARLGALRADGSAGIVFADLPATEVVDVGVHLLDVCAMVAPCRQIADALGLFRFQMRHRGEIGAVRPPVAVQIFDGAVFRF